MAGNEEGQQNELTAAGRGEEGPRPDRASQPVVDPEGTVHVARLSVPLSAHMSEEAKRRFIHNVEVVRAGGDLMKTLYRPRIELGRSTYPVTVEEQTIAGVKTDVVTPSQGVPGRNASK